MLETIVSRQGLTRPAQRYFFRCAGERVDRHLVLDLWTGKKGMSQYSSETTTRAEVPLFIDEFTAIVGHRHGFYPLRLW